MNYKMLGNTDTKISEFALGCWPFAGGKEWGFQEDTDSIAAVDESINQGINFFDTAPGYGDGRSEQVLGKALKTKRLANVIATKVPPAHLKPKDLRASCEKSLNNLQTDYIDLYQIHWPRTGDSKFDSGINMNDSVGELNKLHEEGKIRSIGVSNFGVKDFNEVTKLTHVVSNQLPYNGVWRSIEFEIQDLCIKENSGIICYTPLAQGILTGRYKNPDEVPDGISRSRLFSKDRSPLCLHNESGCEEILFTTINKIRMLSDRHDVPMAVLSLGWLKTREGILSILVGARTADEVKINVPAFSYLPDAQLSDAFSSITEEIKNIIGKNPDLWHGKTHYR